MNVTPSKGSAFPGVTGSGRYSFELLNGIEVQRSQGDISECDAVTSAHCSYGLRTNERGFGAQKLGLG